MILWRISNYADLSGEHSSRNSARWHSKGRSIVYLSDSPSLALLEKLVNVEVEDLPRSFQLLKIETALSSEPCPDLPADWKLDQVITKGIGDTWLAGASAALLKVPSVILPESWNFLLNPLNSDATKIKVIDSQRFNLDQRLR